VWCPKDRWIPSTATGAEGEFLTNWFRTRQISTVYWLLFVWLLGMRAHQIDIVAIKDGKFLFFLFLFLMHALPFSLFFIYICMYIYIYICMYVCMCQVLFLFFHVGFFCNLFFCGGHYDILTSRKQFLAPIIHHTCTWIWRSSGIARGCIVNFFKLYL
jgi:hypothetical protein